MVWDYAEANVFGDAAGDFGRCVGSLTEVLDKGGLRGVGSAQQADAQTLDVALPRVFLTDPPYYDNIGYADLSRFSSTSGCAARYGLFSPISSPHWRCPKSRNSWRRPTATAARKPAEAFFLDGMTRAMRRPRRAGAPSISGQYLLRVQTVGDQDWIGHSQYGLGDFPRRGDAHWSWDQWYLADSVRTRDSQYWEGKPNALASSIVPGLPPAPCRRADGYPPRVSLRPSNLNCRWPLTHLQRGNIAPVDLAQAAIGPGMAVYTRYAKVLDAEGNALPVREALTLINQTLDEVLAKQEGDFDADSRWALAWFEQSGFDEGEYGIAEDALQGQEHERHGHGGGGDSGLEGRGRSRLLKPEELSAVWDPTTDPRLTAWEMVSSSRTSAGDRR